MAARTRTTSLEALFARAEARLARLQPHEAHQAMERGALLVDIRTDLDRRRDGCVPGSLHIPRTVLEWRVAPDSPNRSPYVGGPEEPIMLLCDHGYSSVFAAATLVELGFRQATDVVGGFAGWRDAGLPTCAAPRPRPPGEPAGMRPPHFPRPSA